MEPSDPPSETTQRAVLLNKAGLEVDTADVTFSFSPDVLVKFSSAIGIYVGAQDGVLFYHE